MSTIPVYETADLTQDLSRAGIQRGDNLIVHSSLKSIGRTAHGARTVVDALLDAIGPEGNLMVPTYTYSLPIWNAEPFDYRDSKSRVGAITEEVRNHPSARRSFHPTHSVAVIGPDAEQIVENHLHSTPIGRNSPFDRMLQRDAKILMLGTNQDTNSSLHLSEVLSKMPYIDVCFNDDFDYEIAWFFNEMRQVEYVDVHQVPGCSRGFRVVEPCLSRDEVLKDVAIGKAESQLLSLRDLITSMEHVLQRNPTLLLCDLANCAICPRRRMFMAKCHQA